MTGDRLISLFLSLVLLRTITAQQEFCVTGDNAGSKFLGEGPWAYDAENYYRTSQVTNINDTISITIDACNDSSCDNLPHVTGQMRSAPGNVYSYGWYEASFQPAGCRDPGGIEAAIISLSMDIGMSPWTTVCTISLTFFAQDKTTLQLRTFVYNVTDNTSLLEQSYQVPLPWDPCQRTHVYALHWTSTDITVYLDGTLASTVTGDFTIKDGRFKPMFWVFNLVACNLHSWCTGNGGNNFYDGAPETWVWPHVAYSPEKVGLGVTQPVFIGSCYSLQTTYVPTLCSAPIKSPAGFSPSLGVTNNNTWLEDVMITNDNYVFEITASSAGCPANCHQLPWQSGALESATTYGYGWYEADFMPGCENAGGLTNYIIRVASSQSGFSLDLGGVPLQLQFFVWNSQENSNVTIPLNFNPCEGFNKYALQWTPSAFNFIINGNSLAPFDGNWGLLADGGNMSIGKWTATILPCQQMNCSHDLTTETSRWKYIAWTALTPNVTDSNTVLGASTCGYPTIDEMCYSSTPNPYSDLLIFQNDSDAVNFYAPTQITESYASLNVAAEACDSGCNNLPYKTGKFASNTTYTHGWFETEFKPPCTGEKGGLDFNVITLSASGGNACTPYTVVPGDYGYAIADKLGVSFDTLSSWNPTVDWGLLQIGQIICGSATVPSIVCSLSLRYLPRTPTKIQVEVTTLKGSNFRSVDIGFDMCEIPASHKFAILWVPTFVLFYFDGTLLKPSWAGDFKISPDTMLPLTLSGGIRVCNQDASCTIDSGGPSYTYSGLKVVAEWKYFSFLPYQPANKSYEECVIRTACEPNPCQNGGICTDTTLMNYTCSCPYGWNGTHCENDINECVINHGNCSKFAACINGPGNYYCAPYVIPNSVAVITGATLNGSSIVLSDTQGGQVLRLNVSSGALGGGLGNSSLINSVQIFYGTVAQVAVYPCAIVSGLESLANSSTSQQNFTVQCTIPPGVGENFFFTLRFCSSTGSNRTTICQYWLDQFSTISFGYPHPLILPQTLRFSEQNKSFGSSTLIANALVTYDIAFEGQYLVNDPSRVFVYYGSVKNPLKYNCTLDSVINFSTIICHTSLGASGQNLRFTVIAGNVSVTGTDEFNYPALPMLQSIQGCKDFENSTWDCPTTGGTLLNLRGSSFVNPMVLINGQNCLIKNFDSTSIGCILPPGAGYNLSVLISSTNFFSPPSDAQLSYAAPKISSMAGCHTLSPSFSGVTGCNRDGGDLLSIMGDNFGPPDATILIGTDQCTNVTHSSTNPHGLITCAVPRGSGLGRSVLIIQNRGQISAGSNSQLLSYAPCPPGTQIDGLNCSECPLGTYSGVAGSESCLSCEKGRFANATGFSACEPCTVGRFASGTGNFNCSDCPLGEYIATTGQDTCIHCPLGEFSNISRATICSGCEAGFYQNVQGSTNCSVCKLGLSSDSMASDCVLCDKFFYTPYEGSKCQDCRGISGAVDSTTDRTACECDVGYFRTHSLRSDLNWSCQKCPQGANCATQGISLATLEAQPGYWRVSNASLVFYPCLVKSQCLGGSNATCAENRVGPICASCAPGYKSDSINKICNQCPDKARSIGLSVVFIFLFLLGLGVMYYLVLRSDRDRYEVASEIVRSKSISEVAPPEFGPRHNMQTEYVPPPVTRPDATTEDYSVYSETSSPAGSMSTENGTRDSGIYRPNNNATGLLKNVKWNWWDVGHWSDITLGSPALQDEPLIVLTSELRAHRNLTFSLKIVLGFFQIMTNLAFALTIPWPAGFLTFLQVFKFVNFDFIPWQSLACVQPLTYYNKLAVICGTPIALFVILAFLILIPSYYLSRRDMSDNDHIRLLAIRSRSQLIKLMLFTLFLMYPAISAYLLGFFDCMDVGGVTHLVSDFDQICYSPEWNSYLPFVIIFCFIYPIGIPALFFSLMWRKRRELHDEDTKVALGFLYEAFNSDMWWFELVDMLHKLILTSLLRFIKTFQVSIALGVVGTYTLVILVYRPYLAVWDDKLHLLAQAAIFSLLLSGYVLLEGPLSGSAELALSVLLSALVVLVLLIFILRSIVFFRTLIHKRRRKALMHLASTGRRDNLSLLKSENFGVSHSVLNTPSIVASQHLQPDPSVLGVNEGIELEASPIQTDPNLSPQLPQTPSPGPDHEQSIGEEPGVVDTT